MQITAHFVNYTHFTVGKYQLDLIPLIESYTETHES